MRQTLVVMAVAFLLSACAGGPAVRPAPTALKMAGRVVLVTEPPHTPTARPGSKLQPTGTPLPPLNAPLPANFPAPATTPAGARQPAPEAPNTNDSASASDAVVEALVIEVVDGQNIRVDIGGEVYAVSYLGITTAAGAMTGEAKEPEATAKNRELVAGKTVRLERDVSDTDQDGRLLRYVYAGDMMVNGELVRLGLAQAAALSSDVKYRDLFLKRQTEARAAGRGLWGPRPGAAAKPSPKAQPGSVAEHPPKEQPTPKGPPSGNEQPSPKEQPDRNGQSSPKEQADPNGQSSPKEKAAAKG